MRAELTKARTLPSTAWLAGAVVACTVLAGAMAMAGVTVDQCSTPSECAEDTTRLSLSGVWLGQAVVVALAAGVIGGEYGTGMIRTTLAAQPRRVPVLLAKAAVLAGIVGVAGSVGVLGSLLAGRLILPGNGFTADNGYPPISLADEPTARAAIGTVLYLMLVALLTLGVGTLLRDTAAAVTAVLTLLYAAPIIVALVADPTWHDRLERASPMTAGLSIQATTNLELLPIDPWPGLGVLAAYAAGAMLLGTVVFTRRDA